MRLSMKFRFIFKVIAIVYFSFLFAQNGILNVGFDIDDTVLFSRDVFLNLPEDKRNPTDWGWINSHDDDYSQLMTPTVDLIHFFHKNGHNIFFITARSKPKGKNLANFLTDKLMFPVEVNKNLFFSPRETIKGTRYTTKQRIMKRLRLDLFYGDADTDMIAALSWGSSSSSCSAQSIHRLIRLQLFWKYN